MKNKKNNSILFFGTIVALSFALIAFFVILFVRGNDEGKPSTAQSSKAVVATVHSKKQKQAKKALTKHTPFFQANVTVPQVAGLTVSDAKSRLEAEGLTVGQTIKEESDSVKKGHVIRTDPAVHEIVQRNSNVNIYESTGDADVITLENYVGKKYDDAVADLISQGVDADTQVIEKLVKSDAVPAGTIVQQTPGKGHEFNIIGDGQITLEVSAGQQIEVPDYKTNGNYMTYTQYQAALKDAGFTDITLDPQPTTSQRANNYVYSVYPGVGEMVDPDREIVVTYSVYQAPASTSTSSSTK